MQGHALFDATAKRLSLFLRLFDAHMSGQARSACLASLCADLPKYDGAKDDDHVSLSVLANKHLFRACT
jgi:hypothetical protein